MSASRQLDHLASMPGLAHTTMERPELRKLLLDTGGELMLNGRIYAITSEHLGAGVYRVSTKLAKAGGR